MISFGVSIFADVNAKQRVASEILHSGFWSLIKSTFLESCVAHLVKFGFLM